MDEEHYRSTISEMVNQSCPFERSLLANHCKCSHEHRFNLAEREGVRCEAGLRNKNCRGLYDFLRQNVGFTFHLKDKDEVLPYAKQIKMQAGGLLGLQKIIYDNESSPKVDDIYQLVLDTEKKYTELHHLPMTKVLKEISSFKVRHRRK